jgi:hypothetical protein
MVFGGGTQPIANEQTLAVGKMQSLVRERKHKNRRPPKMTGDYKM